MKKVIFLFLIVHALLVSSAAVAQYNNWAVGFQLGDPSGVNVRRYFGQNRALDLSVGTYGLFYGRERSYRNGSYKNAGFSARVNYLWHTSLFKNDSFRAYYGFGGQLNSRRYYFVPQSQTTEVYDRQISLGATGLAGLEYFLPNNRLSVFLETGVYAELIPAIFYLHPQISGGVRMNF
jgi:hypothetical protein